MSDSESETASVRELDHPMRILEIEKTPEADQGVYPTPGATPETRQSEELIPHEADQQEDVNLTDEVIGAQCAPRDINADVTQDNETTGRRTRRPPQAYGDWQTYMTMPEEDEDQHYYAAFSAATHHCDSESQRIH